MPLTDEQKETLSDARSTAAYLSDTPLEQFEGAESDPVTNVRLFRDLLSIIDTLQADAGSSLRWVPVSEGLPVMKPKGRTSLYWESTLLLYKPRDHPAPLLGTLLRCDDDPDRMPLAFVSRSRSKEWKPADVTHYCIITGPDGHAAWSAPWSTT